jgi:hypothetical protein
VDVADLAVFFEFVAVGEDARGDVLGGKPGAVFGPLFLEAGVGGELAFPLARMVDLDADLVVRGVVEALAVDGRGVDDGALDAHADNVADANGDDGVAFGRDEEGVVEKVAGAAAVSRPAQEMEAECAGLVDAVGGVWRFVGDAGVILEVGVGPDGAAFPKSDSDLKEQEGEDDGEGDVHGVLARGVRALVCGRGKNGGEILKLQFEIESPVGRSLTADFADRNGRRLPLLNWVRVVRVCGNGSF